jgi:hypothetical protein
MKEGATITAAGDRYAAAHAAPYKAKARGESLKLRRDVLHAERTAREREPSRSQTQNGGSLVVTNDELCDALDELSLVHVTGDHASRSGAKSVGKSARSSPGGPTLLAPTTVAASTRAGLWRLGVATSALESFVDVLALSAVALCVVERVSNRGVGR